MEFLLSILFFLFVIGRAFSETQRKQRARGAGESTPPRPAWPPIFPGGPLDPRRDFPPVLGPPWLAQEEDTEEAHAAPEPAKANAPETPALEGTMDREGTGNVEGQPAEGEGTPGSEGRDTLHPEHEAYRPPVQPAAFQAWLPRPAGQAVLQAWVLAEMLGPPPSSRRPRRKRL